MLPEKPFWLSNTFFIEHYFISSPSPLAPSLDHLNGQSFFVFIGQLLIELVFFLPLQFVIN